MEVTFRYTEDDMRALARRIPWHKRWEALWWVLLFALIGMLTASIAPVMFGFWAALVIGWTLFAIGVFTLLVRVFVIPPSARIDVSQVTPITMRLHEDFWQTGGAIARTRRDWLAIRRIDETSRRIFLFIEPLRAFVIPKSAFASESAAAAFLEFARRRVAIAQRPPAGNLPRWPLTEPDLLAAADNAEVIRGQYTPTLDELLDYALQGVNRRQPGRRTFWVSIALLAALGLLVSLADAQLGRVVLCVVAALISLGLVAFALRRVQRWRRRVQIDPLRLQTIALAASPRGISLHSATEEGHVAWSAYTSLRKTDTLLVLDGRKPNIENLVIPRRAFAGDEDAARFEALAAVHIKPAADFAAGPDGKPIPRTAETGNPYQPPLQQG